MYPARNTHTPRHSRSLGTRRGRCPHPTPDGVGGKGLLLKGRGKPLPAPAGRSDIPQAQEHGGVPSSRHGQESGREPAPRRAGYLRRPGGCGHVRDAVRRHRPCRGPASRPVPSRGTQEEPVTRFLPAFAGGCSCVGSCCTEPSCPWLQPSRGMPGQRVWGSGAHPGPVPPCRPEHRHGRVGTLAALCMISRSLH